MNARPAWPRVSVIVPCRNDAASLPLVLAALERQTYPREQIQILVVDNGSTDGSWEAIRDFSVERLREPVRSAYRARNRGIAAATGEYLLFLDADTVPCSEWIAELVLTAQAADFWLAGGRIENAVARPTLGSALLALARPAEQRRAELERTGQRQADDGEEMRGDDREQDAQGNGATDAPEDHLAADRGVDAGRRHADDDGVVAGQHHIDEHDLGQGGEFDRQEIH